MRLADHGPNRLPRAGGPSAWALLARQVDSPLMVALLVSAGIAIALGELEDGLVVLAVVVLNALIGFGQELRAGRAIAALADLVAEPAPVRRDGRWADLPAEAVVPGDLVALAAGDRVPADVRVLHGDALRTQESALTGESEPVAKAAAAVAPQTPLAERTSIAYAGTTVAAGAGRGVVVATGPDTELGRISALLEDVDELRTPLTRELDRVGRVITACIAVAAVALAAVAAIRGFPAGDAALAGISLAVAAVPEGLPAVVTIALAIGVQRMARRRAIVRHLPAVETLGRHDSRRVGQDRHADPQRDDGARSLWSAGAGDEAEVLRAGVLCNDAVAAPGGWLGDPTETALLAAAERSGLDPTAERARHPRLAAIPFDSDRRLMATVHRRPGRDDRALRQGRPRGAAAPVRRRRPGGAPPGSTSWPGAASASSSSPRARVSRPAAWRRPSTRSTCSASRA